ncbi:hypothetical protein N0V93_002501 [Gnomoniopsis smithogilvyi]|uniref:Uncharacterized protein n=1 Tax=Gnomoniopsis smithogilvyi TaxID=1191159 RepID=A0A9W8YWS2_9PEZI|nr:hypothetical protein N0V93_002501 [Gnomoniopsis smithogilvyi]
MSRARSCLVALSMAMAVNGLAAPEITARAVIAQRGSDCPYVSVSHQDSSTSIQGCCVGGSDEGQQPFLSVCDGWPICNGPTTTTWTATPISCAAMIAFTDANYDAELSSAEQAFKTDSTDFCYTVGGADNCSGGSAAKATTTSDASSAEESGNGSDGATGSDAAATGGDAAATGGDAGATGGTAIGSAGSAGSAVNSGNAASNTGTSSSGSSGNSTSSNSGSSGSSSSSSGTTGSGSSSSGSSSSSTSSTTTTTSGTSGANVLGLGWGAWALGLAGVGPVAMAMVL